MTSLEIILSIAVAILAIFVVALWRISDLHTKSIQSLAEAVKANTTSVGYISDMCVAFRKKIFGQ